MSLGDDRAEAARLRAAFEAAGAEVVDCAVLQPADTLLDLYGEDIRSRAYTAADPVRGEVMLRPDFTVPVALAHMNGGVEPARYTYSGEVFRRQEDYPERASEYLQVGFEVFDRADPQAAEAEVFAVIASLLDGLNVQAVTGDIGILTAAVTGLVTTEARRAALMRHLWRPRRFRALLDRYSGRSPAPSSRVQLLAGGDPMAGVAPLVGARSAGEIAARVEALREDAASPPLSAGQVDMLDTLLKVSETCANSLEILRDIAVDLPAVSGAVDRFSRRCDALAARGIDVDALQFEASYGRSSMEYYDGFVFGFVSTSRADWPPVASGGRYDALTRALGGGVDHPAVGGVIRPALTRIMGGGE